MSEHVQILLLHGFLFFGTANGLLERIRKRVASGALRFLLLDLRRVSGLDSSAVAAFAKVSRLAEASGVELVITSASEPVRAQLRRGGIADDGAVRFEPDLDRGLQRCEDALLGGPLPVEGDGVAGMPPGLVPHLERREVPAGTAVIRQDDPSADLFVLESGRLAIEIETPDGTGMRLRTVRPGVVVGEVAMYTGAARTANVVAETPSVVLRLTGPDLERLEVDDPALAAAVHRWLARTVAGRLDSTQKALDALV
jgi:SulP family sulfate permease